ncbi:MAG: HAMP domain-containing histidine kinase [Treponema sp.]|jgi:nitrogen fixation/metabolism regulation signal transduction histidine kinase|nr:HAMP domain-containing histidine kinase [Treponema sp.]
MKAVRTRPKYSIINVRGLIFIYILLCILTAVFSRTFFADTLYEGRLPGQLNLIVFFTIPAVLLIFLGISAFNLFGDIIARRPGVKFKARLLGYFIIIVVFTSAPMTLIAGISINEIARFWRNINTTAATAAARTFAVDNYSLHTERFEDILEHTDFSPLMAASEKKTAPVLPAGIAAVQDFALHNGVWEERAFAGKESGRLPLPPESALGYVSRELPRDTGLIRYVTLPEHGIIRLISYSLGEDFDAGMAAIENQGRHFEVVSSVQANMRILLFFYYGVFFFPTLLMTVIIAISFTRRVTNPIVELTEATRRVAEGDFSIQILARRGDELGLLIRSFNAMVQDLEKSRAALVKAEKISIWQNMAQQLAHEIKNPLTPIKLSAEWVLRRWRNDPERIGEILEDSMLSIIQETEGLSTLLNEFRTLSKPMEPSQSWTILHETAVEVIGPYRSSYPGVEFDTAHIGNNISIKIDKHRLTQVLTNLIINAIDAMNGKGLIEIRTDIVKKRETRYCRLSIRDTGKGIGKQESPFIFTPYFTTKESGTGLGLPIVERIINDHGGTIWFNSADGMGTTFFIDLPVNEDEAAAEGVPSGEGV